MRRRMGREGSFMLEHAAVIMIVVAAFLAMAVYVKRAIMGRYREVGDAFGQGRQFDPDVTTETVIR